MDTDVDIAAEKLRGQVLNLDIDRIENKQIRNVKNKDLTPFPVYAIQEIKVAVESKYSLEDTYRNAARAIKNFL